MALDPKLQAQLRKAVKHFWSTRLAQAAKQGTSSGARDAGERTAVTGGAQMDGFVNLVRNLLCANGLAKAAVFCERCLELPG